MNNEQLKKYPRIITGVIWYYYTIDNQLLNNIFAGEKH